MWALKTPGLAVDDEMNIDIVYIEYDNTSTPNVFLTHTSSHQIGTVDAASVQGSRAERLSLQHTV